MKMENDRLNIDKLFRENLSSREIPSADRDWADIEKMLNNESKKRGMFWIWFIGSILFLMCAGAIFIATQTSSNKVALSKEEEPNLIGNSNEEKSGSEHNSSAESKIELNTPDSTNTSAPNRAEPKSQATQSHSPKDQIADQKIQGQNSNINSNASKNFRDINKKFKTTLPQNNFQATGQNQISNEIDNYSQSPSIETNPPLVDVNPESQTTEVTNPSDQFSGSDTSHKFIHSPIVPLPVNPRSDLMSALQTRTKLFAHNDEILRTPDRISALPSLTNWTIGLSLFGGNTANKIEEQNDILKKRNQEELNSFHWGFLLETNYKVGRSQFGMGLGYEKNGENIQYSSNIMRSKTYITSEWQNVEIPITLVDSVFIDGEWVIYTIDTTYFDTLLVDVLHVKDSLYQDDEITKRNGTTTIQNIVIPLSYRFDLIRFHEKAELFLGGTMQLDYAIKRKADYLDPDSRELRDINTYSSYRTLNSSATLGLGLRWHHSRQWMTVVEIYRRTNLFSWNTEFNHRYTSTGIRLGVYYNF